MLTLAILSLIHEYMAGRRQGRMPSQRVVAVLGVMVAFWATYKVSYNLGKRAADSGRLEVEQAGFVLAVGLKFKSVGDRDELLKTWKTLAIHTRDQEKGALSYKWLVADNDPTKVLVYERYTHKEAYTGPHRESKPFFEFKDAQKKFDIEITGQSYIETEFGFM